MKFSIRDIMWLTVVVALVLGWWMDHRRQSAEIDELKGYIFKATQAKKLISD